MDTRDAIRVLNPHPVIATARCARCGAEVPVRAGVRFPRRYCSDRCRAAAYYHAHKSRALATQRARRQRRRAPSPPAP